MNKENARLNHSLHTTFMFTFVRQKRKLERKRPGTHGNSVEDGEEKI